MKKADKLRKCEPCQATGRVPVKRFFLTDNPLTAWHTSGKVCPTCNGKKYIPQ